MKTGLEKDAELNLLIYLLKQFSYDLEDLLLECSRFVSSASN